MIKFLIVVTGWNWEQYIKRSLSSILKQKYGNYCVAIMDDGSTDNSSQVILDFFKENIHEKEQWLWTLNFRNAGTFFARDRCISLASNFDYDAIVFLDGDDELLPNALEECAKKYKEGALMTYGNWINQDGLVCPLNIKYSKQVHDARDYRNDTFRCTHLRTFHRKLYEAIPKWTLTDAEIQSYPDVEILFSMMEMCGENRIGVIYEPIYRYNETNENRTLKRFGKDYVGYEEIQKRPKRALI